MIQDTKYFIEGRKYKVMKHNKIVDVVKCIEIERNRNDHNYIWFMGNNAIDGTFRIQIDKNGYEYITYSGYKVASNYLIMYNDESITILLDSDNTSKQYFNLKR